MRGGGFPFCWMGSMGRGVFCNLYSFVEGVALPINSRGRRGVGFQPLLIFCWLLWAGPLEGPRKACGASTPGGFWLSQPCPELGPHPLWYGPPLLSPLPVSLVALALSQGGS